MTVNSSSAEQFGEPKPAFGVVRRWRPLGASRQEDQQDVEAVFMLDAERPAQRPRLRGMPYIRPVHDA